MLRADAFETVGDVGEGDVVRQAAFQADIPDRLERIRTQHILRLNGREISFNPDSDLNIRGDQVLPKHPNGLNFTAYGKDGGKLKEQIYYSVGGGFMLPIKSLTNKPNKRARSPTLTPAAPNCSPNAA